MNDLITLNIRTAINISRDQQPLLIELASELNCLASHFNNPSQPTINRMKARLLYSLVNQIIHQLERANPLTK